MDMRAVSLSVVTSLALSGAGLAQTEGLLSASPIPEGAASAFCYYGGLAYSPNALLLIDIPYRRQGPDATQNRLLRCVTAEGGGLGWEITDEELSPGERG